MSWHFISSIKVDLSQTTSVFLEEVYIETVDNVDQLYFPLFTLNLILKVANKSEDSQFLVAERFFKCQYI